VGVSLLGVLWIVAPQGVWAHTGLLTAAPVPGALLTTAPTEIRLTFSEPNDPLSRITLFAPGFRTISGVRTAVDPAAPAQLVATLPPLAPDTYTVQWVVVATDQHMMRGSYTFAVRPQQRWLLWLSVAITTAIWLFCLGGTPWRLKPNKR